MNRLLAVCVVALCACPTGPMTESDGSDGGATDGGGRQVPADAFSALDEPLPSGTTVVDEATFRLLSAQPDSHPASRAQRQADDAAAAARVKADTDTVDAYLAVHADDPAVVAWGQALRAPVDPALPVEAEGYRFELTQTRIPLTVMTLGTSFKLAAAAESIRALGRRDNQLTTYRALTDALPANLRDRYDIAPASVVETLSDAELLRAIDNVALHAPDLVAALQVPVGALTPLRGCEADFGRGKLLDRHGFLASATVEACDQPRSTGLVYAWDWPLKKSLSCVKSQGRRGTCWSFAATSMMETLEAVKHQAFVNYSEQDLVNRVKLQWWSTSYGDNSGLIISRMVSEHYRPVYENAWSYNPSSSRTADDAAQVYTRSCDNYTEDCSNTNHQGRLYCYPNGVNYCVFVGQANPNTTNAPLSVSNALVPGDMTKTVALVSVALAAQRGVELAMDVYPAFDAAASDGWVRYDRSNKGKSRGGHMVHLAGFISNAELARVLPNATPGEGGGYFLIKNSWSVCAGDAGYYYVPVSYVADVGWAIEIINDIE